MMSDNGESDLLDPRWKRFTKQAPMIPINEGMKARSVEERFIYFHKLASSLNHAAQKIQGERDFLNKVLFEKERQIKSLQEEIEKNIKMIRSQLSNSNKQTQELLEENQALRKEIKELEIGHLNSVGD